MSASAPFRLYPSDKAAMPAALSSAQSFMAALIVIGFVNGIAEKVVLSVHDSGFLTAFLNTFDLSLIVWAGCAASVWLLLQAPPRPIGRRDLVVGAVASLTFLVPVPAASWAGIMLIALHVWQGGDARGRAAAGIAFALTVPTFWVRLAYALFLDPILVFHARLVALAVGTTAEGNMVPFADGSGGVYLEPACASLGNIALAILGASIFLNMRGARWTGRNVAWLGLCCAAILAIDVVRIALIALHPAQFDLLHGPLADVVAGWSTLIVILVIGYHRIGRDAQARP